MPYTSTIFGDLVQELADRLGDRSRIFWTTAELRLHLREALRTFGVLSAFWRERASITLTPGQAFYDLTTTLGVLTMTVTDRDLIRDVQYALLEPVTSQTSWTGTEQFSYADVAAAVRRYRDQFLADAGILLRRSSQQVLSPQISRHVLTDETIIDIRRAAWIGAAPFEYYSLLWREDERALTHSNPAWSYDPGTPEAYSVMAPPPLQIQLGPPPVHSGRLELITVNSGPALNPAVTSTVLGIPDDLTPAVKWGALGYLLSRDGEARDAARADYAATRYQQYVELARLMASVVHSEINGKPVAAETLHDIDAGAPNWQDQRGEPEAVAMCGWNLAAVYPTPDDVYSATFDVVRRTPMPASDSASVQIGVEQIDALMDYAEHLALFKAAGAEFAATMRLASEFLMQAAVYNQRLSASARYILMPKQSGQKEEASRPRRLPAEGLGAAPSTVGSGGRS